MNAKTAICRKTLQEALGSIASQDEIASAIQIFDRLAKFGPDMALEVAVNSLGLKESHAGAKEYIAAELKKFAEKQPKIESSSEKKLLALIARLNKKISDCAVTVNNQDISKFAAEQAKIKIAPCLQEKWNYSLTTATGSIQEKLVLEVVE